MAKRLPAEETARLGEKIYERDIRPQIEGFHHGEIVAIDVDGESWAIADSVLGATELLRAQCPETANVWSVRVGHRAVYSLGGGSSSELREVESSRSRRPWGRRAGGPRSHRTGGGWSRRT